MSLMESLETLIEVVRRIEVNAKENFDSINGKIDSIIERNGAADLVINTIKTNQDNHDATDKAMFTKIEKKHSGYDKFVLGVLIFGIVESVGIIIGFAMK